MPGDGTWYNEQENKNTPCLLGLRKGGWFFFKIWTRWLDYFRFLHLILMALYFHSRIFQGKERKRMDKVGHTWNLNPIVSRLLKTIFTNKHDKRFYSGKKTWTSRTKKVFTHQTVDPFSYLRTLNMVTETPQLLIHVSEGACHCILVRFERREDYHQVRITAVKLFQPYKVTLLKNKPKFGAKLLV